MLSGFTRAEVSKHNKLSDLWLAIHGQVYDFTDFVREHPGGIAVILKNAGRDATTMYTEVHSPNLVRSTLPPDKHLGSLTDSADGASPVSSSSPSPVQDTSRADDPSARHPLTRAAGEPARETAEPTRPPLSSLISAHDFEAAAAWTMTPKAYAFVSSAATDTLTHRANAAAYSQITIRPRVLVDVSAVSTATAMLGHRIRVPFFVAPTAMAKLVHPDGELALARACRVAGAAQCVSTSASFPLEEIAEAARTGPGRETEAEAAAEAVAGADEKAPPSPPFDVPLFFQLYVDRHRPNTDRLLRRARSAGYRAVFLTVDAPLPGKREADERLPLPGPDARSDPAFSPNSGASASADALGSALGRTMGRFIDPAVSWSDLPLLRAQLGPDVPLVLKGVQTWMDAARAADSGVVDAVVLSNHGGRSLDTSPASVLVLLELRRRRPEVFGRIEVYVDGGVARGTDVFKALCLGATAVGVGRGPLYALGYGVEGVVRYLNVLRDELETTMKMAGVTSLSQLHPGLLNTRAVDHLIPAELDHEPPSPPARQRPVRESRL